MTGPQDCMKREMHSWDRERQARRFALAWIYTLVTPVLFGLGFPGAGVLSAIGAMVMFWRAR